MIKLIFALVVFLLFIWRIKKGFAGGILKEIVTILSGVISLASVALLIFAITSVMAKAMSTLAVCIAGLILLGLVFKICNLIFTPILALNHVFLIGELDKILGAVLGAAEACILSGLFYYVLLHLGADLF